MAERSQTAGPTRGVLVAAARVLIASAQDDDFPIAEIMLRNILIERAKAAASGRLENTLGECL